MGKTVIRVVALVIILLLLTVFVPAATPLVIAEESVSLPVYEPQTLTAGEVEAVPYGKDTPYAPHADAFLPDNAGYVDPSLSIRIDTLRLHDTDIMLAWVQIAHPSQLRAALYRPYPSKKVALVSQIAKREQAVLAINGDWFMDRKEGYIVRNGNEPYRTGFGTNADVIDLLVIDENADFHVIRSYDEDNINEFLATGHEIIHSYAFGPALVVDGEISSEDDLAKLRLNDPLGRAQRMAICQMDALSYLIVATEGPENENSLGLTVPEMAQLCHDLGAKTAYNLDGGNSTCIALNYKKINGNVKKPRSVGDILYFVTAVPEE